MYQCVLKRYIGFWIASSFSEFCYLYKFDKDLFPMDFCTNALKKNWKSENAHSVNLKWQILKAGQAMSQVKQQLWWEKQLLFQVFNVKSNSLFSLQLLFDLQNIPSSSVFYLCQTMLISCIYSNMIDISYDKMIYLLTWYDVFSIYFKVSVNIFKD